MIARNSDRDTWKLEHWDEYIASCNFEPPVNLKDETQEDSFLVFKNSNEEEFNESMVRIKETLSRTMQAEK